MSMDYYKYKARLDKTLDLLRARYIGQELPLSAFLPAEVGPGKEKFSDQVAQVLTLQIARWTTLSDKELCSCWQWIYAATLFLHSCPKEDRTVRNLIRLARLDRPTLELLDLGAIPRRHVDAFLNVPRFMERGLELTAWYLAEPREDRLKDLEDLV